MRIIRSVIILVLVMICAKDVHADIRLTVQGRSEYKIYHLSDEVASVKLAARELQDYLQKASAARLPIVTRRPAGGKPFIGLGSRVAVKEANLDLKGLSPEGYRVATKNRNIFIFGVDSGNGKKTPTGGKSNGTLNGVYSFLEDYVGVRWLMPGEFGEDVPVNPNLSLPVLNSTYAPVFVNRRIAHIQKKNPMVKTWLRRQRQGYSLELNHYHNFHRIIPASAYDRHPEWFPMFNGVRPRPTGRYKLETTNNGLVRAFADKVIKEISNKKQYAFSISPTDGRNWSESPESRQLYDTDPHGKRSMTHLVLTFYNQVAKRVGSKLPHKVLCGYIYSDYLYPPSKGIPQVEPNLVLVVAPSINYGYRLYQKQVKRDFDYLIESWAAASKNIAYYDLPVTHEQSLGAPNPPAFELLSYIYERLVRFGYKGIYIYGTAWGQGALTNYLLAKLNWNPEQNVKELARDFFIRAYGKDAAPFMEMLFAVIDTTNKKYHINNAEADFRLTSRAIKQIYVANLGTIENLFKSAKVKVVTPAQIVRLEIFETAMVLFYQHLGKSGLIKADPQSPFYKGDLEIAEMLSKKDPVVALSVGLKHQKQSIAPVDKPISIKPLARVASRGRVRTFYLRGPSETLLYASRGGRVSVTFTKVRLFGESAKYLIRNSQGLKMAQGVLMRGEQVGFTAKPREVYFLDIMSKKSIYAFKVNGFYFALRPKHDGKNLHFNNKLTPLYFWVDKGQSFSVTISSNSLRETAAAALLTPAGATAGQMDTSGQLSATLSIGHAASREGFWALIWKRPRNGNVDDVWLQFDKIAPWIITDPSKPLRIAN